MRDDLLFYYEQELAYLRRMGAAFAEKYLTAAARLVLGPAKCEGRHVESYPEGLSSLAARAHLNPDVAFTAISDALLSIV